MLFQDIYKVVTRSSRIDQRRLQYTIYVCWLLIPVLIIFPRFNSYTSILATVILGILVVILMAYLFSRSTAWQWGFIALGYAAAALLYFVHLGYGDGGSVMWIFAFPMLAIFMLGLIWGVLSALTVLLTAAILMGLGESIGGYAYSTEFIIRFVISFALVTGLASGFEYWRVAVEIQKEQVGRQLDQARDVLKEFTSVCAWCSSIRDGHGDWQSLETYVERKEDTTVSHSICPGCQARELAANGESQS